jgi:hypothetical protein
LTEFTRNLKKYIHYAFDTKSFKPTFDLDGITEAAKKAATSIRGMDRQPAIILHGITKRSGTVYVGELLSAHPKVSSYPNNIWEIPFLPQADSIIDFQNKFFLDYQHNVGRIGGNDFLPLFGASFIHYLYSLVPTGYRLLVKMPGVQYLNYFYLVFPGEHLLLLTRDGRDVVSSTVRTWPQIRFSDACRRWDRSAKMVLACHEQFKGRKGYWLGRYEEAVEKPEAFIREACARFGLDIEDYPNEKIDALPVIGSSTVRKRGRTWIKKTKSFKPIGRWQNWSTWQIFTFKRIAGGSLLDLGYCDNLDW